MNLLKLRLSMAGTIAVIITISTLGFSVLLALIGQFNFYSLILLVAIFNIAQWLLAPYMIKALYGVRPFRKDETPHLQNIVKEISASSGIKTPKLMYSKLTIPNAFAYGSPLSGSHVAVTKGLLNELETEEVEAVIAHEIGHIKHRDVQVMMFVSFLPSLFYLLARSFMFSRYYGRDRRNSGGLALIGGVSMLIYFILLLFNLNLSRLREYYADQHSVSIVNDGARKLSEGLAKISTSIWRRQRSSKDRIYSSSFKTLFITDPDRAGKDTKEIQISRFSGTDEDLVRNLMTRRLTFVNKLTELFSTHPNIIKRLRALKS